MQFPLLLLSISAYSFQNVFRKKYSSLVTGGDFAFNAIMSLFATVYFFLSAGQLSFDLSIIPYAILFAACCGVAMVSMLVALREGSYALTNMILSYSLVIPTLYGPVFLGETISYFAVGGIAILLVSLYLVREPKETGERKKTSAVYLIAISAAFVSTGMCSVSQKIQQIGQSGLYKNEFMIAAMAMLTVVFALIAAFRERPAIKSMRLGALLPSACGLLNGISNHMVLILTGMMSTAIFFPILSASSLVISFVLSLTVYREKLLRRQIVAALMSIVAIILLNI